jgi:ankyrin repeat protein
VDIDGWTLLHVAASYGSFSVIPLLLQAGANPQALSIAAMNELMCGEVTNRPLTPMDLVRANHGTEGARRFDEELKKTGFVTCYTEGEIFWNVM